MKFLLDGKNISKEEVFSQGAGGFLGCCLKGDMNMLRRSFLLMIVVIMITVPALLFGSSPKEEEEEAVEVIAGAAVLTEDIATWVTLADYQRETGKRITEFHEAPGLAALVASGEIEAVGDRLPDEPSVIAPVEMIGSYGGRLTVTATSNDSFRNLLHRGLFRRAHDGSGVLTDIATGYDFSDDYKVLTINLREGVKWSDGAPFTVDDILFWWEDIQMNPDVSPGGADKSWYTEGEYARFEKIDDYTLRITFTAPKPAIMDQKSHPWGLSLANFFAPRHYLEKWHIDYNPNAQELAEAEGYEHWYQALSYHLGKWQVHKLEDMPTLSPWVVTEVTTTYILAERNPYFWQIDTEGNQLPYIDEIMYKSVGDTEAMIMDAIAGNIDQILGYEVLALADYPLMKENEESGGYRVIVSKALPQSAMWIVMNPITPDNELREIFNDIRFRQAVSIAIDRDSINEVAYFGLAEPRQRVVLPSVSFYKEDWGNYMIEFDIDRANELLDEMGLEWNRDHTYRLRPDGEVLDILMESGHGSNQEATVASLIAATYGEIGIKLTIRTEKTIHDRIKGDQVEMFIVDSGGGSTQMDVQGKEPYFEILGAGWNDWFNTDGSEGVEPPDEWKQQRSRIDEAATLIPLTPEWTALEQQIWDFKVEQLWHLGTVYQSPALEVVNNDVRNVPEGLWIGWTTGIYVPWQPQQWFKR